MKKTKIQWCHSSVNPVMGCDGCELWSSPAVIAAKLCQQLVVHNCDHPAETIRIQIKSILEARNTSEIYEHRNLVVAKIQTSLGLSVETRQMLSDVIRRECKCYAGLLGTMRSNHPGYADRFEDPKLFPGRMSKAADWGAPTAEELAAKPWLPKRRLIFVSDMGDALSKDVSFEYLQQEIIQNVDSASGRQHIWLWLTKRPKRMAEFGQWLAGRQIAWPDNLVAMTTVTSQKTISRITQLQKVPSRFKALSIEPLFGPVELPLAGIDWVIVGGGSDVLAEPFHCEWTVDIRRQCKAAGAAFFLKQLGKNPVYRGQPLELKNKHGGDWSEWPEELRIREMPAGFVIASPTEARP